MTKPRLSKRELQCLEWVATGKTSWEIGVIIGLSERTVNFHLLNGCRKLQVFGRQAGVAQALRYGLLSGNPHLSVNERTNSTAFSFESDCFGPEATT